MRRRKPTRDGYALLLVLIFVVLFLSLLGVTWRRIASVLRIAQARTIQTQREEGSLGAMAAAMTLLETGRPPAAESPYIRRTTITLSSGELRYFLITFQHDDTPPPADASPQEKWSVTVSPQSEQPTGYTDLPAHF